MKSNSESPPTTSQAFCSASCSKHRFGGHRDFGLQLVYASGMSRLLAAGVRLAMSARGRRHARLHAFHLLQSAASYCIIIVARDFH